MSEFDRRKLKIGFVPPRELSAIPENDGCDSPLMKFINDVRVDAPNYFWAVYCHTLLNADPDFTSPPAQGETRHTIEDSFPDATSLLTQLALLKRHSELFTAVTVVPQVTLGHLAQQYASLANISQGRFSAGVAVGWNEREYGGLGMKDEYHKKGALLEQKIPALEMLLTGIPVNLTIGREEIRNMGIKPAAKYPVPIWIGGGMGELDKPSTHHVLKRIARYGAGWLAMGDLSQFIVKKPIIDEYLDQFGRDTGDFGYMGRVTLGRKSLDECMADMLGWVQSGATHIALTTHGQGNTDWKFHSRLISEFIRTTEWIRHPHEPFYKTFAQAYGWPAPKGFDLLDRKNMYYFFMHDEIPEKYLLDRLNQLGYAEITIDGTNQVTLVSQGDDVYIRSQTYVGKQSDLVAIFGHGEKKVVFYEP